MEVVTATPTGGGVNPFHDHDVREWSRIDSLTGALERARLETDHWSATTMNSSHNYGKVVDSLSRTDADGALQHAARRQLEVFHSQVSGARLQVVKTHSVAKWTNKTSSAATSIEDSGGFGSKVFENLQLSLNPLDLTSQKSKASILRSVSRRPPTRQRPKEPPPTSADQSDFLRQAHITAATNLHRVSRLCHQIHDTAVRQAFARGPQRPTVSERSKGESSVEIVELETLPNDHTNLSRTRSSSSEDINQQKPEKDLKSVEDLEDLEQLQNWRRTSKIRRSLQFPKTNKPASLNKPIDLPESSVSVRRIKEELEKGRRLNTALRNNSVDLDALDQILQSISSASSDKASDIEIQTPKKHKRNSFVTVESIQEVKGRLRRTSSPTSDIYKVNGTEEEDPDDGIVTEESTTSDKEMSVVDKTHVRSYVYGMETMLNKKPGLGTGSLESRIKLVNGTNSGRSEDWYNRRKSYGFEQVHSHEDAPSSMPLKNKNVVESSTDSGICRSTEIVVVPKSTKSNGYMDEGDYSSEHSDSEQNTNGTHSMVNGIQFGQVKKLASTFGLQEKTSTSVKNLRDTWSRPTKDECWVSPKTELKSTTITIPIAKNNNIVDLTWNDEPEREAKRHSIAVDESKYVAKTNNETRYRRTSLALNDQFPKQDEDEIYANRKTKKVEFCKTEVHFAAESGKVNIVATDEKPPPTHNFRRRRRNSGPTLEDFNKNGLPVLHFGDSSYEKNLFGMVDDNEDSSTHGAIGVVTVNTNNNMNNDVSEEDKKELTDNEIKGILKNKMIKPRPYHLGEPISLNDNSEEENKWGVRLRHVDKPSQDTPIWKSTVTVQNYFEKQQSEEHQPEFQKLLKNLRPTKKTDYASDSDNRFYEENLESRRSSWATSDRKMEDNQKNESTKGYSTKINFGDGQATVVQNDRVPTWSRGENLTKGEPLKHISANTDLPPVSPSYTRNSTRVHLSPVTLRKYNSPNSTDLKSSAKLSSPSLVGRNINSEPIVITTRTESPDRTYKTGRDSPSMSYKTGRASPNKSYKTARDSPNKGVRSGRDSPNRNIRTGRDSPNKDVRSDRDSPNRNIRTGRNSPSRSKNINTDDSSSRTYKTAIDKKLQTKHSSDNIVLRQPKKSEMTYFGISVSPKPLSKKSSPAVMRKHEKLSSEKPDLLQHYRKPPSPKVLKKKSTQEADSPIYENMRNKYSRDFDSSILDELTKAADQILQAVNDYEKEETFSRNLTDDDESKSIKPLETIAETKSWKPEHHVPKAAPQHTKARLRHTSSTSSADSVNSPRVIGSTHQKGMKSMTERQTKKAEKPENPARANTKARRLQRASSREALLQSHGSSSEDLPAKVEVSIRKPRMVKKTKASQFSMNLGPEMKKSPSSSRSTVRKEDISKDERVSGILPEIRHKTAVSTIRSTTDKSIRDRPRQRTEEARKKTAQRKDITTRGTSLPTGNRTERERTSKASTGMGQNKENVTQHRISTANIKKFARTESGQRH